jgi:hypothetical protein
VLRIASATVPSSLVALTYARIDKLNTEVAAIEAAIPAQKRIRLRDRMGPNEKVSHQPSAWAMRAPPAFLPQTTCRKGGLVADRIESNAEKSDGSLEGTVIVEVSTYLSPDNVAGYERAYIVRRAQGFPRGRTEARIATKDIEEYGRVDRRRQERRERDREPPFDFLRGPASRRAERRRASGD